MEAKFKAPSSTKFDSFILKFAAVTAHQKMWALRKETSSFLAQRNFEMVEIKRRSLSKKGFVHFRGKRGQQRKHLAKYDLVNVHYCAILFYIDQYQTMKRKRISLIKKKTFFQLQCRQLEKIISLMKINIMFLPFQLQF